MFAREVPKVTDPGFQLVPGYLPRAELPDSLALLGPPPGTGSAAMARDEEAREATLALRGGARWALARADAQLAFPHPAERFSCALGVRIDEQSTPRLYRLMQRMLTDVGLSTYGVKNRYQRTRPFVAHGEGTCAPEQEDTLRGDGSYPSGHTAVGWGWALVLGEIAPSRSDRLLSRGIAFGQSRVVCNAHWQSDVDAGRIMGAATVARLHAEPAFLEDLRAARAEVEQARRAGALSSADCAMEAAALAE